MQIIIIFCALLVSATTAFAYDKQALIKSYFSTVMIRGYNQTGGLAYGSGVVVDKDTVITNCHVFRSTNQPWISRGQDSYAIKTVRADTWHDLCLVTTDQLPLDPVRIGESLSLKRGQEVAGIGHSSGSPAPLTSMGSVNGLYAGNPGNIIRTNAKFLMGASGSGLYNMDGYLIGINTFKTAGKGGSIHFALPVEWIEVLKKLPEETKFPITGKALWEEDEDKKPFYMQAAVPESRYDWPKLEEVATRWSEAEPKSPDAWMALGVSQEKLGNLDLAKQYYEQSIALDANNIDALMKVGNLAKNSGDQKSLNHVYAELIKIDKEVGEQYKAFNECNANC
ncbi:MAG: trypsin-like peptidase domain-containing protein [Methylophilaceae bacterium]